MLRPYVPEVEQWLGRLNAGFSEQAKTESYHTRTEVAKLSKTSIQTVDRLIKSGELKSVKIRRSVRIPDSALRSFLNGGAS